MKVIRCSLVGLLFNGVVLFGFQFSLVGNVMGVPCTVEVAEVGNTKTTKLTVNSEDIPLFLYKMNGGYQDTVRMDELSRISDFEAAGVRLYVPGTYNIHYSWGWASDDSRWSTTRDWVIQEVLDEDPDAYLLPQIKFWHTSAWADQNADQFFQYRTVQGDTNAPLVNPVSEKYWRDVELTFSNMVEHLEQTYGDRIIGYVVCFGDSGESSFETFNQNYLPGFDEVSRSNFQSWAENKYSAVSELNNAWGKSYSSFDDIEVPGWSDRNFRATQGEFENVTNSIYVADFNLSLNQMMPTAIGYAASKIKTWTEGKKLVGAYYSYMAPFCKFSSEGRPGFINSGHAGLNTLLSDTNVNFIINPLYPYYDVKELPYHSVPDSLALHQKLYLHEIDINTSLSLHSGEKGTDVYQDVFEPLGYLWKVHQERNLGSWYFSWTVSGETNSLFADSLYWDQVEVELDNWSYTNTVSPDIVVIRDERSPAYMDHTSKSLYPVYYQSTQEITEIKDGAVGYYLLEDLINGDVPSAKLYIFQGAFVLGAVERNLIQNQLAAADATAVWMYAPGYVNPDLRDAKFNYVNYVGKMNCGFRASPIADYVEPVSSSSIMSEVPVFGSGVDDLNPQFRVLSGQSGVESLALYSNSTDIAIAKKLVTDNANGDWTSVVCFGGLTLSREMVYALARDAGCSNLFYPERFADGDHDGWVPVRNDYWQSNNGALQMANTVNSDIVFTNICATDFVCNLDYKINEPSAAWGGISFRKTGIDNWAQSGYTLCLYTNGTAKLIKATGSSTSVLASETGLDYDLENGVQIQIVADGDHMDVSIDYHPLFSVQDSTWSGGYLGACAAQTKIQIDNVYLGSKD